MTKKPEVIKIKSKFASKEDSKIKHGVTSTETVNELKPITQTNGLKPKTLVVPSKRGLKPMNLNVFMLHQKL